MYTSTMIPTIYRTAVSRCIPSLHAFNNIVGSRVSSRHPQPLQKNHPFHRQHRTTSITFRQHSVPNDNSYQDPASFDENTDALQEQQFATAALLCFIASQNKSLFAAKCLVETIIEIYRYGYTIDNMKLSLTLMTLTADDPITPILQDVFLTWAAIIFMTLRLVGVPLYPHGEARLQRKGKSQDDSEDDLRLTSGLEAFVRNALDKFLSGTDLFRLQLQQGMQADVEGDSEAFQGGSPAIFVLQQNTRLAIITLEVVRLMRLPTVIPLNNNTSSGNDDEGENDEDNSSSNDTTTTTNTNTSSTLSSIGSHPIGYVSGFLLNAQKPTVGLQGSERAEAVRGGAIRLMIAFNGAALGYIRSARSFIEEALACYSAGWTADEIFTSLNDEEFAQSGGILRFGVARLPSDKNICATLFARWLSIVYITLAQMAVAFPGADEKVGWAWVCSLESEDSNEGPVGMEAHGLSEFVSNTLRLAVQSDEESGGDEEMREHGGRRHWEDLKKKQLTNNYTGGGDGDGDEDGSRGFTPIGFEDPELMNTSSFTLMLTQQLSLVRLTRVIVLNKVREMEAMAA